MAVAGRRAARASGARSRCAGTAGGETAGAFEALNRAGDWAEFTAAVERFAAPSQNFVYADVDGQHRLRDVGRAAAAIRRRRHDAHRWHDRRRRVERHASTPSTLPRLFNPERGYITSSNNQIDRQWPGLITRDWAAPYRATRLQRAARRGERRRSCERPREWQNDVTGLGAGGRAGGGRWRARRWRKARRRTRRRSTCCSSCAPGIGAIDDRPVVTLYHLFEDALWRRTFVDEMGDPLFNRFYEWAGAERPAGLYAILDDPTVAVVRRHRHARPRETRDDIFVLAAADAADRLAAEFVASSMRWADVHARRSSHPLGRRPRRFGWLFNRGPSPLIGDTRP